jgi:ABC-type transporter Mla subunit MlaD
MEQLNSLAEALQQVTGRQRDAIDELVSGSATTLQAMSAQFNEQAGSGVAKLAEVAAHFTGSSAELASLAEAFNAGVDAFSQANDRLIDNLARIEESMQAATARSDEQMGYYVAQAREIIDQSMLSQQGIIEDLRQLGETRLPAKAGAS